MDDAGSARLMRWFTQEWHTGELSDEAHDAAFDAYHRHLSSLTQNVPVGAQELSRLNLHDGQVQEWKIDDGRFAWRMLIGDFQHGYEFADVVYFDAELVGMKPEALKRYELDRQGRDLVSGELDTTTDARLEHRFYFWPRPQFGVRFSDVTVMRLAAPPNMRR